MRLNNWSIAASYDTARIFAGLGFGATRISAPNIRKNRLVVMLGRRRYGRLQRQADRCFIAHEGQEVSGPELREWCWPERVLLDGRPITEYQRQSMCRAARSIAEAGNTAHELMAISGHCTLTEVQRYTEDANRKHLADSGMSKLQRGVKT